MEHASELEGKHLEHVNEFHDVYVSAVQRQAEALASRLWSPH
jgi:hypothetical protein